MRFRSSGRGAGTRPVVRSVKEAKDEKSRRGGAEGKLESKTRLVAMGEELKALKKELAELRQYREIAFQDPLTELGNRRYLDQRLAEELKRVKRRPGGYFSLIALDMDNLKFVNDEFGHGEGDRILHWIGQFLVKEARQHDVCCRLGGDEFMLLLPVSGRVGCRRLMERIRASLEAADGSFSVPVRLSLGAATYPEDGQSAQELFICADRAMYTYKREHKLIPHSDEQFAGIKTQARVLSEVTVRGRD